MRGSHGLSARRARRTKSRMPEGQKAGPKGRQLEVGAQRAPRLLVPLYSPKKKLSCGPCLIDCLMMISFMLVELFTKSNNLILLILFKISFLFFSFFTTSGSDVRCHIGRGGALALLNRFFSFFFSFFSS